MSTRALLASPLGVLIGVVVGALGGGGSILVVPVLVFIVGQDVVDATSTSLVVVGVASAVGAYGHWRSGRVRVTTGLVFGAVGVPGSVAGSLLNRRLDDDVLLLAFAGLILVAAWRIAVGCPSCTRSGEAAALAGSAGESSLRTGVRTLAPARLAKLAVSGTVVGFLSGLFGVGGGFLIVPALALALGFPMRQAVGTSLLVIVVNTAAAFVARLGTGSVDWGTTLLFTAAATAGVGVGKRVADRVDPQTMQRGFSALLVLVALYTGARALFALY